MSYIEEIIEMISIPLFKQSVKSNLILWISTTFVICFISSVLTLVLAPPMAEMADVLALQGYNITGTILMNELMGTTFYGLSGVLAPMIYVIVTGNKLISDQVDRGSMAYVLSTPTKRSTVSITQIVFFVLSLFVMFTFLTITAIISAWIGPGEIDFSIILLFNLGVFLTMLGISGMVFMFSSIFSLSKYSLGIGGGLTVMFFLNKILGLFGSDRFVSLGLGAKEMDIFNYFTILTLFDAESIAAGTNVYIWKFIALIGITIITYIIGFVAFVRKDLPL